MLQRFDELKGRLDAQEQKEKELQLRYKTLTDEQYNLKKELAALGA